MEIWARGVRWMAIGVIRRYQLRERTKVEEQNEEAGEKL